MNGFVSCLTPERLRQLSADELSPRELELLEEHITHCEKCRDKLAMGSAEPGWWEEVRDVLTDSALPRACSGLLDGATEDAAHDGCGAVEQYRHLLGPTDDPRMLGRIGPYEVVGILGRGGMGVVFKGFDGALNRYVAIKMLLPHLATSGGARKRFAREAQAAAAVIHDNVMAIHSVAEWQGVPYLVMPYGRGVSLQRRLSDNGPLEVREILRIGMQTAQGLAAAHAQGLVHRDVKPANILLGQGVERITLTDFGLARAVDDASLTRIGVLAGTPQYMSPEQASGKSVDARSDLFSLGSVLYAACTGRSPFRADSSYGVLRLILDEEPTPIREINPDIPEWLCAIISKLMSKQAANRFESADQVAELLEQCLAHVQHPTAVRLPACLVPEHTRSGLVLSSRRSPGVIVMIAALGLGLLGLFAWQATEAPDISGNKVEKRPSNSAPTNPITALGGTREQPQKRPSESSPGNLARTDNPTTAPEQPETREGLAVQPQKTHSGSQIEIIEEARTNRGEIFWFSFGFTKADLGRAEKLQDIAHGLAKRISGCDAEIKVKPDTPFNAVSKVEAMLKEFGVRQVTYCVSQADSGYEIIVTCSHTSTRESGVQDVTRESWLNLAAQTQKTQSRSQIEITEEGHLTGARTNRGGESEIAFFSFGITKSDLGRPEKLQDIIHDDLAKRIRGCDAEITVTSDAPFNTVSKVAATLKELGVRQLTCRVAKADSGYEIIVTCSPDSRVLVDPVTPDRARDGAPEQPAPAEKVPSGSINPTRTRNTTKPGGTAEHPAKAEKVPSGSINPTRIRNTTKPGGTGEQPAKAEKAPSDSNPNDPIVGTRTNEGGASEIIHISFGITTADWVRQILSLAKKSAPAGS